jgi:hypothetical protein
VECVSLQHQAFQIRIIITIIGVQPSCQQGVKSLLLLLLLLLSRLPWLQQQLCAIEWRWLRWAQLLVPLLLLQRQRQRQLCASSEHCLQCQRLLLLLLLLLKRLQPQQLFTSQLLCFATASSSHCGRDSKHLPECLRCITAATHTCWLLPQNRFGFVVAASESSSLAAFGLLCRRGVCIRHDAPLLQAGSAAPAERNMPNDT